jgi:pimeloyl-ACP methyl ester carboxylesterase
MRAGWASRTEVSVEGLRTVVWRGGPSGIDDVVVFVHGNPGSGRDWGGGDPYVPARFANLQTRYFPGARVVVLPDSGHWPLVDDPEAVIGAVVPFLRSRVGAGR